MQVFTEFEAAKAACDETEGMVVSGCSDAEEEGFVYFLTPAHADEHRMMELSYEARFGEKMDPQEAQYLRFLAGQARAQQ